jgi:protein-tyrosine phosphatase
MGIVVVDLRRPNERQRDPSRRWAGFAAEVIDNDLGVTGEDPWHAFLRGSDLSVASIRAYLVEYYRRAAVQGAAPGPVPPLLPGPGRGARSGADPLRGGQGPHGPAGRPDPPHGRGGRRRRRRRLPADQRRGTLPPARPAVRRSSSRPPPAGGVRTAAMRAAMGVEADYLAAALEEIKDQHTARSTAIWSRRSGWTPPREAVRAHILL